MGYSLPVPQLVSLVPGLLLTHDHSITQADQTFQFEGAMMDLNCYDLLDSGTNDHRTITLGTPLIASSRHSE